ncbi:hypothetical protein [Devosia sp. XK-2]|uniref:hypothetical protein n=1 Tax=Devosia sp. XK-2 TaxID=3126689 RepID=UPI0030D2F48A
MSISAHVDAAKGGGSFRFDLGFICLLPSIASQVGAPMPGAVLFASLVLSMFVTVRPSLDVLVAWASRNGAGQTARLVLVGYASLIGTALLTLPWLLMVDLT